jgi:hypothetical protein
MRASADPQLEKLTDRLVTYRIPLATATNVLTTASSGTVLGSPNKKDMGRGEHMFGGNVLVIYQKYIRNGLDILPPICYSGVCKGKGAKSPPSERGKE